MLEIPDRTDGLPVLLRRDLIAQGLTDDEIRAAVARGELERPARGAVSQALPAAAGPHRNHVAASRYLRRVMARALRVPSCVVSHASAAAMHHLPVNCQPAEPVHLTRPGKGGNRVLTDTIQHAGALAESHVVQMGPIRVTSVARTLVDVGRTEALRRAVAVADAALHRSLVTGEDVAAAVAVAKRTPGMRRARRALALADGRSESVGESALRVLLHGEGLGGLDLQINVYSAAGRFLARCDAGLIHCAVLIEFDGEVKYRALVRAGEDVSDVVIREKLREQSLTEAGFVVFRVTWEDLRRPKDLMRRLRHAMELGRRNLAAGTVTGRCVPLAPLVVPV